MDTPETPIVDEANNNEKTKPVGGFNAHPENINRNGRPPKGYSITDAVKDLLTKNPERKKNIVEKVIALAENGDPVFVKLAWNYMDGMPKQEIEQTGELNLNVNGILAKAYGTTEPDDIT